MGYTHYWRRPKKITKKDYDNIVKDFKQLLPIFQSEGVSLGDGVGEHTPIIEQEVIVFNGRGRQSHETFFFPREMKLQDWEIAFSKQYGDGKLFNAFCKTNRKPYDTVVMCFLIIAKHHLKNNFIVTSDGYDSDWTSAKSLCQEKLRYGKEFMLDKR